VRVVGSAEDRCDAMMALSISYCLIVHKTNKILLFKMSWPLVIALLTASVGVSSWIPSQATYSLSSSSRRTGVRNENIFVLPVQYVIRSHTRLYVSETLPDSADVQITEEEFQTIVSIHEKSKSGDISLDQAVFEALPTVSPELVMKLRGAAHDEREEFRAVSSALSTILDARLNQAREVLASLLNSGEVRKLDSLIGKACREGKLDVAFFQVLNMNLQDAAVNPEPIADPESTEPTASRFQILQHIYTRCQEEIEKTIPPGVSLLNKLLRTEQPSIRSNQLNHYLCPQKNVITTPDGKELKLEGREKILVSHEEFVDAIGNAVKQIRTIEKAGGTTREMAANMVESCRQVAKEARIVIGEHFGRESDQLHAFEESLQPIFRPDSAESPYIKGE